MDAADLRAIVQLAIFAIRTVQQNPNMSDAELEEKIVQSAMTARSGLDAWRAARGDANG